MKKYNHISKTLKDFPDSSLHIFRSGGGLRVSSIEVPEKHKPYVSSKIEFYGEGPNLEESLRILNDDIEARGREYKDVYGPIETHYLTGSYAKDKNIPDALIVSGGTIDVCFVQEENSVYKVEMKTFVEHQTPPEILKWIFDGSNPILWEDYRGKRFLSYGERNNFGIGCCTKNLQEEDKSGLFIKVNYQGQDQHRLKADALL